ncbi:MAG: MFS transporter [Caldilineaceae bacterium]
MVESSAPARYRLASFPLLMTVSVLTRLLVNTANQLFNPFLTIIAAGLGVDVIQLGQLLGLRNIMAVFAPLFGSLADRWGYRCIMRLELLIGVAGFLLIGSSIHLWMTMAGMLLMGLGFYAFVPTLRAYLAGQLPYNRRARGFGILEYSWALSGIVGFLVMGQVIALAFAISIVGGALASFTGPPVFTAYGVWGLGPVTACALLAAIVIMRGWVEEITSVR